MTDQAYVNGSRSKSNDSEASMRIGAEARPLLSDRSRLAMGALLFAGSDTKMSKTAGSLSWNPSLTINSTR